MAAAAGDPSGEDLPAVSLDPRRKAYLHKLEMTRVYLSNLETALRDPGTPIEPIAKAIDAITAARFGRGKDPFVRLWLLTSIQEAASLPGVDGPETVRLVFGLTFPERASTLCDEDLRAAIRVWTARGNRKAKKDRPLKWAFLAEMMDRAGFGKVTGGTLEQDWIKWAEDFGPGGVM